MSRDIKFRAWNKKDKYMELVDELQMFNNDFNIGMPSEEYFLGKDDVELMQFTGLHDKNGKEIFEGDIILIKNDTEKLIVKWYDGAFVLVNKYDEHFEGYVALYRYMPTEIEVIRKYIRK